MNQLIFWLFLQHPSRFAFIVFYLATGLLAGSILVLVLALLFLSDTAAKIILLVVLILSLLSGLAQAVTRQSED
jgi:protein-S-isoprenylcysteine O-methyltransferase Ste14